MSHSQPLSYMYTYQPQRNKIHALVISKIKIRFIFTSTMVCVSSLLNLRLVLDFRISFMHQNENLNVWFVVTGLWSRFINMYAKQSYIILGIRNVTQFSQIIENIQFTHLKTQLYACFEKFIRPLKTLSSNSLSSF